MAYRRYYVTRGPNGSRNVRRLGPGGIAVEDTLRILPLAFALAGVYVIGYFLVVFWFISVPALVIGLVVWAKIRARVKK
jgi:hypothetical protein